MPDLPTLALFCAFTLGLLVVPGPAVLYIVTRTVAQGRSAGLISVLGVHAGSVVHVAAAALGLSALLAASATAYTVVKWGGVAYLVWLGVRNLVRRGGGGEEAVELRVQSKRRLFWEGVVVNVLNPKTAIFFLAFLPQFTTAAAPIGPQILLLGLLWIVLGMASDGTYAMLASALAGRLRASARVQRRLEVGSGLVYLGLAAWLTTEKA
ncbi:Homoserine/homoserine lactone efflux protein [Nonomuraea coxensis DSM 45129]|uniref:Homoserine/homoserine lactone efflux protein n=1 Tax=Nonomuraea coxensis DSM 45129 TaxID=1122611 RepID=A0ABX8TU00_9ACTN|nr:LysE family translocator [Nonomuraea coxensis]QYC38945.1 Homoserine/homoserine lactone efflux protein [Nonomuraea coxensis DSM 45129]